jgi:hypothetical protein
MHIQRQTPMELVLQGGTRWMAFVFVPAGILVAVSSVEKHKPLGLLGSAFFLLFAAAFFRHSTFTLDKMQRIARWRRFTVLKNETGSIPFDSIRDIIIDAQAGDRNSASYRLILVTPDDRIPMDNVLQGGRIEHYERMRQQILEFVGLSSALPAADPGLLSAGIPADLEPSLRALLAQRRTIDAIELLRSHNSMSLTDAKSRIDELEKKSAT